MRLETGRLLIREYREDDLEELFYRLISDSEERYQTDQARDGESVAGAGEGG